MTLRTSSLALALVAAFGATAALAERLPAPDSASVYIISPESGQTVQNPVTIKFGLTGMGVAPAGVEKEMTGHHHLLINVDPETIEYDYALPATDEIVHFGGGQTEVTKDLPAGTHTLQLLLGDHNHIPHDPPILSDPVTITVE